MNRHHHPKASMPAQLSAPTEIDDQPAVTADDAEISDVLENLDVSGAKVKVYRKAPNSNKYAYVDEYPSEGFSVETLKSNSGGGEYRLGIHDAKGRRIKRVDLSIDSRFKGALDPQPFTPLPVTSPAPNNDAMLQVLMQAQQSSQAMFLAMMQAQQQSSQQMTQMMVAALTGNKVTPTTAGEPASRMLEAMMPLLLANVQKGGGNSMKEQLDTLKALKELLPEGAGGEKEEKDDILDKVIKLGGPIMAGFLGMRGMMSPPQAAPMQQLPQVSVQPPEPAQAAPAPAPAPATPPAPVGQALPPEDQQMIMSLRQFVPVLVNAAAQDSECLTYHDLVADLLTDAQYERLVEILRRPDWITILFADDPSVVQFKPWFENLRDPFINPAAYEDSDDAPSAPTPAGKSSAATIDLSAVN